MITKIYATENPLGDTFGRCAENANIVALTNSNNVANYHKILDDSIAGVSMLKSTSHRKAAADGIQPAAIQGKENTDETK